MILRVFVGLVFLVHGATKLFGFGVVAFAEGLEQLGVPLPLFFAITVALVELLGGAVLMLGLLTRFVAIPLAIEMLVAILLVHLPNGFFTEDGGYEFPLVMLAASVALAVAGSGELALDKVLAARASPTLARYLR